MGDTTLPLKLRSKQFWAEGIIGGVGLVMAVLAVVVGAQGDGGGAVILFVPGRVYGTWCPGHVQRRHRIDGGACGPHTMARSGVWYGAW